MQSTGFSNTTKSKPSRGKPSKSSAGPSNKEQQAVALINQGKLQEAEAIYRELISEGTSNHIVYGNLAALCGIQGRLDELIDLFNKAIEIKPNYPDAHYNLGVALKKQGDLTAAIISYNKALQLKPNFPDTHYNLGNALQEQGDLTAAITSYNKALQLKPNFPDAHNNLGNALQEQGDLTAAITSYNKALQLKPNYPEAHNNLGNTLQKQGDLTAAITSYNKALELKPNFPDAHNNLGNTLKKQGDLTAAIASCNKALQLKPNYPEAHYNLGNALQEQGDLTTAITSYNKALQLKPNYPEAHNNLGNALQEQGDLTAAITSYNKALQLKPNYPEAHNNLGNALQEKGDLTAAITSHNNALQLKPNYPEAHINLGNALKDKGDLDEALINHKRALELDPKNSQAFYGIGLVQAVQGNLKDSKNSLLKSIELNQSNTAALFELSRNIESIEDSNELSRKLDGVARAGLNKREESLLEFAAANLHHKTKNYTNATLHLSRANKLKLSYYPSNLSDHLLQTKQIMELAKQIVAGKPSEGEERIFIVGAPRCGSTLLESALSTNPNIRGLGESRAMRQALGAITHKIGIKEAPPSLSEEYTERIKDTLARHTRTIDKNLYNFRYTEAIARAMPSARIIHCRRHPLDNILSMLRSNLKAGNNYTSDPLDAAKFLIHQEEAMSKFKHEYEKHIFTFDYDAFVSNPEKTLQPLIGWLGLEWNDRYLYPEMNCRLINTASVIQARQPITSKSVGGWKNYRELLKPAEEALIESGVFELKI